MFSKKPMKKYLNLCDYPDWYVSRFSTDTDYSGVYVGSYTCCNKFLATTKNNLNRFRGRNLTVVIPTIIEKRQNAIRSLIEEMLSMNEVTQIVANDLGGLSMLHDMGVKRICAGRMMCKDKRDPNYIPDCWVRPKILSKPSMSLLRDFGVSGIELERFHPRLDLTEAPKDIDLYVHSPMMHLSQGNICELSSIGLPLDKKFRASPDCGMQCSNTMIVYRSDCERFKFGNEICTWAFRSEFKGHTPMEIFSPFVEWSEAL